MNLSNDLKLAIENMTLNYKRYSMTLKCILALKHLCEGDKTSFTFCGCELPFKYKNKEDVSPQPDFICQKDDFGIYGEIKSSITTNGLGIKKEIEDIKRLEEEFVGWKTENGEIEKFAIWLLIFRESIGEFLKEFKKEQIKRDILISSWDRIYSLKKASDVFSIKTEYGSLGNKNLDEECSKLPEVEEDKILNDFENIKFFKQDPPILYLLEFLWMDVFTSYSEGDDFIISVKELYEHIKKYYPIWANISGEQEQVKLKWIKGGLDILKKIDLAETIEEQKFKILFHKNPGRDFKKDIAEKICRKIPEIKQKNIPQQTKISN